MRGATTRGRDRGQAPVLAVVLLIGLVAVGSIGILMVGVGANQEGKEAIDEREVKLSFIQLNKELDTAAKSGDSGDRNVDLDLPKRSDVALQIDDVGRIWVNKTNYSIGQNTTIVDQRIGAIQFSQEEGPTFAYQAGGVWRGGGEFTEMISPPGFSYKFNATGRFPTLTMPIVLTNGHEQLSSGSEIKVRKVRTISPLNDVSIVENELIEVTVQSHWYRGWAQYFRALASGADISSRAAVDVDHKNETATLELIVPASRKKVIGGVITGAAGQDLVIENSIGLDSYDSSKGPYSSSKGTNGQAVITGNLVMQNKAKVKGDIEVGGDVDFQQPNTVVKDGNVSYGGTVTYKSSKSQHVPDGWVANNASVSGYEPVDNLIDVLVAKTDGGANDNGEPGVPIVSQRLQGCSSTCTLPAGTYHLEKLDLNNGDHLELDTTGGDITLVIDGRASMRKADVDVLGDKRVNVYVDSEIPGKSQADTDLYFEGTVLSVPGDKAKNFWVYMDKNANAEFRTSGTKMDGVVFGPGSGGSEAQDGVDVTLNQKSDVFGGVVGDVNSISQSSQIHYDQALGSVESIKRNTVVPRLTFLHIVVYEVCVVESDRSDRCSARPLARFASEKPVVLDSGKSYTFDASSSSDDGTIEKYEFDFDGDGNYETSGSSATAQSTPYNTKGVHTAKVKVTDDDGYYRIATRKVRVDQGPINLDITHTPSYIETGDTVKFEGTARDEDKLDYKWDLDGDGTFETLADEPTTTFTSAGEHEVSMKVIDAEDGKTATRTETIAVNAPPTAAFTYSPTSPSTGEQVTFDASGSTDDQTIETYAWDFDGDGDYDETTVDATVEKTYGSSGTYAVKLKVTDNDGGTDTATNTISVGSGGGGGNSAPSATITLATHNSVKKNKDDVTVSFDASDTDGNLDNADVYVYDSSSKSNQLASDKNIALSGGTDSASTTLTVKTKGGNSGSRPYYVEVVVEDSKGATGKDSKQTS